MLIEDIGEFGLIRRISKMAAVKDKRIIVPIGDDAAVVTSDPNLLLILTSDILVEGVHFKLDTTSPNELGYKAMAINISDIAAMAGIPRFALVSMGLKPKTSVEFAEAIYRGMMKAIRKYHLTLVGGDTTEAPHITLSVTIIGEVEPAYLRRRSEATIGDKILVTGRLGASKAGLELLLNPQFKGSFRYEKSLRRAHLVPIPRVVEARIASKHGAHAMEDISDGLASEINHICEESRVGARILAYRIPVAKGVREIALALGKKPLDFALYGGEDYEIVFTAPPSKAEEIKNCLLGETGTLVTEVGEIVDRKEGICLVNKEGKVSQLTTFGYEHFKRGDKKCKLGRCSP
ncbi:MAG: thiamine-phosphate kinase [Actinomycetota bacterium]|nr:thiamine-phosphate kinase [Actinomycetota bacterium]